MKATATRTRGHPSHYQTLGVSTTATPAVITIAYQGKLKALAKADLSEAERKAEERALAEANAILSNVAKKAFYDRQAEEPQEDEAPADRRVVLVGTAGLAALLVGGIAWHLHSRSLEQDRIRIEEQRVAIEQVKERARAEVERARVENERAAVQETRDSREASFDYRREADQRNLAEREGYRSDSNRRYDDALVRQDAATQRSVNEQEHVRQQRDEDRRRRHADEDYGKAWAEVDRQNRWVAGREREEERIRSERHNRVQREAAENRAREAAARRGIVLR